MTVRLSLASELNLSCRWRLPAHAASVRHLKLREWSGRLGSALGELSLYASAVAYSALLSMFPIMLGALSLVGYVLRGRGRMALEQEFLTAFPQSLHPQLLHLLEASRSSAASIGLVSLLGLAWAGSGLFGSLETPLNRICGAPPRNLLRQRLRALVAVCVLILSAFLLAAMALWAGLRPRGALMTLLFSCLLLIAGFGLVYRYVPNRRISWREMWPGAVVGGLGTQLLSLAFPLYAAHFGQQLGDLSQQFLVVFLLAVWLYAMSFLLLAGAYLNELYGGRRPPF